MSDDNIKCCSFCGKCWLDVEAVLDDKDMRLCGYQPFPKDPENSFMLFVHDIEDCGTTVSFDIADFKEYFGVTASFEEFVIGESTNCKGKCLNSEDISACTCKDCPGHKVRAFVQQVRKRSAAEDRGE